MGWNWVLQIARFHEVWVITRANNREAIENALAGTDLCNVHWTYFDLPRWARFWKKGKRGVHPYYYLWQIGAYLVGRRLNRDIRFDLVHHVTFVNYWMPSFLALLPVPFIWGPVGGGESAPRTFWRSLNLRGKVFEIVRDSARAICRFDPFVLLTARRAMLGLATTEETRTQLERLGCKPVFVCSQLGLSRDELNELGSLSVREAGPFRLVSIGNLLHLKGFHLGLQAFARFLPQFRNSEYWIIGEGPDRKRLEEMARSLGVVDSVTFWGALPRSKVFEKLAQCDVLVHPSLHDSGAYVCAEAMAAGRPVICLGIGGPALQVTEETGFEIRAISPEQATDDIAVALAVLATNCDLRFKMGQAGRCRVREHFSIENKVKHLASFYERAKHTQEVCG